MKVLITKRQSSLMGENIFVLTIWAVISSNDALYSPARTKRLLRRLDLPSRGCSAEELVRNHSWWKGPEFLNHSLECWPQEPQQSYIDNEEKALAEIKKTSPTIVYSMANPSINNDHEIFDIGDIIDINRYSTKLKLL